MRWLLTFLLCVSASLRLTAATGDIVQVLARPDGVSLDVVYEGFNSNSVDTLNHLSVTNIVRNTNGTLVTNIFSKPAITTPYAKIHSPGFDSTGTSNWSLRYAWFTTHMRSNYPSQGRKDDRRDSTLAFITNRYSLDMPVKIGDSITVTIPANTYSNNAAVTDFAVVNNSLGTWKKPIANWTIPPRIITNTTMRLEMVGFDGFADGANWLNLNSTNRTGQPLACVKFIVRDEHNVGVTNTVSRMSIDWAYNFTAPFWNRYGDWLNVSPAGYIADIDCSGFTAHDQLRCDFIAYPQWGTNYFSTLDAEFLQPRPSSLTNFYDPNDNFGAHAVVDMLNGSDANGRATNVTYSSINSAHYFKTLTVAINAITGSNNLAGVVPTLHANPGGGKLWVRTSNTNGYWWTEGTLSAGAGTQAKCWFTVSTYPGDAQMIITNRNGDRNVGNYLAFNNVKMATRDPTVIFNAIGRIWLDQCTIDSPDSTGTQMFTACANTYFTRCVVTNFGQGFKAFAGTTTAFTLVRGCDLDGMRVSSVFYTMVGNVHPSTNRTGFLLADYNAGNTSPNPDYGIVYNNFFGGLLGNPGFIINNARPTTNGLAIVQNIFEECSTGASPVAGLGSSGGTGSTNVVILHNGFIGERIADWFSNGTESTTIYREDIAAHGNSSDLTGFKKDYDPTADGDRFFGAPGAMFLVNGTGNYWREVKVNSAAGTFPPDFDGFYSSWPHYNVGSTNIMNSASFVYLNGYLGDSAARAGGSDLRTLISPIQGMAGRWVLPFDILGRSTGKTRKPGPYSESALEKGAGFF